MRLRIQLLLINLVSLALLVVAVVFAYWKMLLTLQQTWLLTGVALAAGLISSLLFGWMTVPLSRSMKRLVGFSDSVARLAFDDDISTIRGPREVRQLAESLQTMSQRLSDSFTQLETMERTRRELTANISHDLRTPLASIQSYVEALQDRVVHKPEEMNHYLQTIHNESIRLSTLIDDLFALSKLEAGQEVLHAEPVRLDKVLADALESCRLLMNEKDLHVVVDVAEDVPAVELSAEKMHRVLTNLLQNAIRYSPPGGQIALSAVRSSKDTVTLSVTDSGPGVNAADKSRLFERFYRADTSRTRHTGGAGLGLAIARQLVELHSGEIGVNDRADGKSGAVFWITLPVHQPG